MISIFCVHRQITQWRLVQVNDHKSDRIICAEPIKLLDRRLLLLLWWRLIVATGSSWGWMIPCCPTLFLWKLRTPRQPLAYIKVWYNLILQSTLADNFHPTSTVSNKRHLTISIPISFLFQFIASSLNFCVAGDEADVIVPWERMRLKVHVKDPATGNTTQRDVPLTYDKLDIFCHPKGRPAFALEFVQGCWEVAPGEGMTIRVDTSNPLSSHDPWTSDQFGKLHGSFSLHFNCGELFLIHHLLAAFWQ